MTVSLAYFGEMPFKSYGITTTDWRTNDGTYVYQFRAVMLDNAHPGNICAPASTPTSAPWLDSSSNAFFGILLNTPNANESGLVCLIGETKVQAGAAFSAGVPLTFNSTGFIIAAASTDLVIGVSRYAASAKGDFVTAIIGLGLAGFAN